MTPAQIPTLLQCLDRLDTISALAWCAVGVAIVACAVAAVLIARGRR